MNALAWLSTSPSRRIGLAPIDRAIAAREVDREGARDRSLGQTLGGVARARLVTATLRADFALVRRPEHEGARICGCRITVAVAAVGVRCAAAAISVDLLAALRAGQQIVRAIGEVIETRTASASRRRQRDHQAGQHSISFRQHGILVEQQRRGGQSARRGRKRTNVPPPVCRIKGQDFARFSWWCGLFRHCPGAGVAYNASVVPGRVRFESFAFALIVATLLVILWGAFVRVTGSGAGCADHWPLCNGELIPRAPRMATVIELTHRVTSGLCGLLSIAVLLLARRHYPTGSPVRRAAWIGFLLMVLEGAIGALLVKKGLVAKDTSEARAFVVGLHLCNTFLLLGAQALTLRFARDPRPLQLRARPAMSLVFGALLLLALLLGASGAVTALGDTLFPARSLAHGFAQDFAHDAHFLVRLRVIHPLLAIVTGALLVYAAQDIRSRVNIESVTRWAWTLTAIYVLQMVVGSLNLTLLAPTGIQITHLLLADLTWLSLVFLAASALQHEPSATEVHA